MGIPIINTDAKPSCDASVLDLPQLYKRPTAAELLATLIQLRRKPSSWDDTEVSGQSGVDEEGLPSYLTSIIASSLAWIVDDDAKEQIWEAASARLSERSGRSGSLKGFNTGKSGVSDVDVAIPSAARTFLIPATAATNAVSITLHEPSLTADNLGHKTWLASFLLAKRLPSLGSHIPVLNNRRSPTSKPRVIELGAGTGLVGLAVAALFDADVHLTDLPAIVPNLRFNVDTSLSNTSGGAKGRISVGALDWSDLPCYEAKPEMQYDLVVAADPLYSPQHPAWLVAAIECVLKKQDQAARVVIELPLREAYMPEAENFKTRMKALGLLIEAEGLETGFDDWESAQNGRMEVECWWAVWRWA
ncbi:MAG: hypothetical protein LQ346_003762 [Caloplaca aetnensis]|nr:MAG: hypothetical protein LQ346_003762 [Caloplaca aetnensis]